MEEVCRAKGGGFAGLAAAAVCNEGDGGEGAPPSPLPSVALLSRFSVLKRE